VRRAAKVDSGLAGALLGGNADRLIAKTGSKDKECRADAVALLRQLKGDEPCGEEELVRWGRGLVEDTPNPASPATP
jgi:hypothetical protein